MKLYRFIFFFFLHLGSLTTIAQVSQDQLNAITKNYVQDLRKNGIDTICTYSEYCIGCIFQPVSGNNLCVESFSSLPTYIFWKDKGKTFATRKDVCFDYSTQQITNDAFWNYYFSNKDKIKKEKLKLPQYVEDINGKKKIHSINVDQSVYFQIKLTAGKDTVTKEINNFYFTKDLGEEGEININYDFNMLTSLNKLHSMIQGIIKQEAIRTRFVKSLRK